MGIVYPKQGASYTVSGAIDPRIEVADIAVDGVGAMTLASPETTINGAEITIIATTANAHTVTYTGGFAGVGTGGDVATFGGAVGDSMRIMAWDGEWYVISLYNVTLA